MRSSIVCCHWSSVCFELSTISVSRALAPAVGLSPSMAGAAGSGSVAGGGAGGPVVTGVGGGRGGPVRAAGDQPADGPLAELARAAARPAPG